MTETTLNRLAAFGFMIYMLGIIVAFGSLVVSFFLHSLVWLNGVGAGFALCIVTAISGIIVYGIRTIKSGDFL